MTVMVLGGAGYIGSHTVYALIEKGYDTINVDNVNKLLKREIGLIFVKVLEYAGVFKRNKAGMEAFHRFILALDKTQLL